MIRVFSRSYFQWLLSNDFLFISANVIERKIRLLLKILALIRFFAMFLSKEKRVQGPQKQIGGPHFGHPWSRLFQLKIKTLHFDEKNKTLTCLWHERLIF